MMKDVPGRYSICLLPHHSFLKLPLSGLSPLDKSKDLYLSLIVTCYQTHFQPYGAPAHQDRPLEVPSHNLQGLI